MGIEITEIAPGENGEWDSYVERSPHATVFHQYAALELFADHVGADLRPLVGYKGQEPVGLLPLFETERGPFSMLHSPPSGAQLMYLGPVRLNFEAVKQRKAEKDHRRFVDACLDWIETAVDPDLVNVRCGDRYTDVRPYLWNDLDASPVYIYVIDLTPGTEKLFDDLTKETRRTIRNTDEDAYDIVEGSVEDTRLIARQVRDRHEEQGRDYSLTPEFLAQLHDRLPDEQVRPYCLRVDDEFVSGLINFEFGDTMHVWQGGVRSDADLPVNELLYWHVTERAASRGLNRLDLTTAMVPSLADYKAKFGPEPKTLFKVRWQSQAMRVTQFAYDRLPETGRDVVQSWLS